MKTYIFSFDGRLDLLQEISYNYDTITVGELNLTKFSDGELNAEFNHSLRGCRVCLIGSTNSSDNLIKLLLSVNAAKRSSAAEIIVCINYYGYARQDRADGKRVSIGAKMVADLLEKQGVDRVVTIDLHAPQIESYFSVPVEHLHPTVIYSDYIESLELGKLTICSPDAGAFKRARNLIKVLDERHSIKAGIMGMHKIRSEANVIDHMEMIGDPSGKDIIIVDDIVDTAGTLCAAAKLLKDNGARSVRAIITHPVLSGPAIDRINTSDLEQLIVLGTIPSEVISHKIKVISPANMIAEAIHRITEHQSLSLLRV